MGVVASADANDMKRAHDPDDAGPSHHPPASPTAPSPTAPTSPDAAPDTECPVCCESYSRAIRKPIACSKCEYAACMACCKKHLTTTDPAACMSCSHVWDYEFLTTNFTAAWISHEYRAHRETILVDREIAQLPASQHLVSNFRASATLQTDLANLAQEKTTISRRLHAITNEVWNKRHRLARITASRFENDGLGNRTEAEAEDQASRTFIRACPVEDCRGFLSSALKCGTCDGWACAECLGIVGETRDAPHTCDADDVATAKLIKRDTKPCPSCATLIYKVDGCDQMWCISCRTPFSWRTGRIIQGTVHNPEYFRFLRERAAAEGTDVPRQPGDIIGGGAGGMCGNRVERRIDMHELDRAMRLQTPSSDIRAYIYTIIQKSRHVEYSEMAHLARRNQERSNADLRLKYLTHKVTHDEWKRLLLLRERKRDKEIALRDVYEMFVDVANDIFRSLIVNSTPTATIVDQLREIVEYTNASLTNVQKRFKCNVYAINIESPS
jgi:hypothetical protein